MTQFFRQTMVTVVLMSVIAGCGPGDGLNPDGSGPVEPMTGTAVPATQLSAPTAIPADPTPDAPPIAATGTPPITSQPIVPSAAPPTSNMSANADVLFVSARETAVGLWSFSVEVAHPDTGWDDYADGWDVVLPDGTIAKASPDDPFTRLLLHPHETEQPFTRSQSNIPIPPEITTVTVRAHDLVDGFGGQEVIVDLTAVSGENYEVTRLNQ